jgi:hypothetical protein
VNRCPLRTLHDEETDHHRGTETTEASRAQLRDRLFVSSRCMRFLVIATRVFLGIIFFSSGLAKLTHGLTPGVIGPVWLEERLAQYGLSMWAQFVAWSQVLVGALLLSQRFATLGAVMLVPIAVRKHRTARDEPLPALVRSRATQTARVVTAVMRARRARSDCRPGPRFGSDARLVLLPSRCESGHRPSAAPRCERADLRRATRCD